MPSDKHPDGGPIFGSSVTREENTAYWRERRRKEPATVESVLDAMDLVEVQIMVEFCEQGEEPPVAATAITPTTSHASTTVTADANIDEFLAYLESPANFNQVEPVTEYIDGMVRGG